MEQSSVEKIKLLDQLLGTIEMEQWEIIRNQYGVTQEEFDRRIKGIRKESEFILALHMMDVCQDVGQIDESSSSLFDSYTSDVIVKLKDDRKFMLEIKYKDGEKYKISGGNLQNRIDFAKSFEMDLYFAISIKGFWMVFKSSYLESKSGKIDLSDHKNSCLFDLFDIGYYYATNIRFESIFSKTETHNLGIEYPGYGKSIDEKIFYKNKQVLHVTPGDNDKLIYLFISESIMDRASQEKHEEKPLNSDQTLIINDLGNNHHIVSEIEMMMAPINHMLNDKKILYTPKTYLKELSETSTKSPYQIKHFRSFISLIGALPFVYKYDDEIETTDDLTLIRDDETSKGSPTPKIVGSGFKVSKKFKKKKSVRNLQKVKRKRKRLYKSQ